MIVVSVKTNIDEVRAQFALMHNEITKAAARGLNRTADGVRTTAIKEISTRTRLKVTALRKRFRVDGANPYKLSAVIYAYGYSPNLGQFDATQTREMAGTLATAWEGPKTYRHTFMVRGKVVARRGKARLPLKGIRGPSSPQTFKRADVTAMLIEYATGRFAKEFAYEWQRRLGG
jgi:Prophage minor tail protein Z (GPZ)